MLCMNKVKHEQTSTQYDSVLYYLQLNFDIFVSGLTSMPSVMTVFSYVIFNNTLGSGHDCYTLRLPPHCVCSYMPIF